MWSSRRGFKDGCGAVVCPDGLWYITGDIRCSSCRSRVWNCWGASSLVFGWK